MVKVNFLNIIIVLLIFCAEAAMAELQYPIGFTYWDVGRCYDTIPSNFYDDSDYTPHGRNQWGVQRYNRKIENIAAVVDSMRMPVVALFGVENEAVVRDIVKNTRLDYSYLHRTIDGRDGLDFALLYFGDVFFIDYVRTYYGRIYIEGTIESQRVGIWLTRFSYLQKSAAPPHRDSVDMVIVAGGLYKNDLKKMGLVDHMAPHERVGHGNAVSYRGWYMRHRIGLPEGIPVVSSGVYINSWLLRDDHTTPKPTISKNVYLGGYSPYLPVYLYFQLPERQPDI